MQQEMQQQIKTMHKQTTTKSTTKLTAKNETSNTARYICKRRYQIHTCMRSKLIIPAQAQETNGKTGTKTHRKHQNTTTTPTSSRIKFFEILKQKKLTNQN